MYDGLSYGDFAYVYDILTDDVEYEQRVEYVVKLMEKYFPGKPELVCDLGCGTGTVCQLLSQKGYDCIGIDYSDSMLNVASGKEGAENILYLKQDISEFELYGTVDVFLCMLDTLNYITEETDVEKMFSLVHNYLNPEGIFIFDVNTLYKFAEILGNNTFAYEKDDVFYTWENYYEDGMLDFYLNFFVAGDDGKYTRFSEEHSQRYYSIDALSSFAIKSGFKILGIYSELTFESPKEDDERVFIVLKKN